MQLVLRPGKNTVSFAASLCITHDSADDLVRKSRQGYLHYMFSVLASTLPHPSVFW
jgi:hypothetical protein